MVAILTQNINCILLCNDTQSDDENEQNWCLENEFSGLCFDEDSPSEKKLENEENDKPPGNFATFIETFIDKLNKFNLQHNVVDEILTLSKELVSKSTEINKQLIRNNPKDEAEFILNSTSQFVSSHIDTYLSRYKRNIHFQKNEYFVAPKILHLGSKNVNDTLYYVSILETLDCLFAIYHYRKEYFDYNNCHRCSEGIYERFCCGNVFKKSELFQSNSNAIQIQFFFDDFQVTSPLKTKPHKVCAIYFTILNCSPKFASQLQNIYLVSLCDATVVANNGCNAILEHLVQDIKTLENDGITINSELVLKGILAQVSFDNLGGNTLFGFVKGFNATYYCRICHCDNKTCKISTNEIAKKIRTKDHYNIQIAKIQSMPESDCNKKFDAKKTTGIENYCILNNLNYFHSIENRSQDIMHDIYEGAMSFTLYYLFIYLSSRDIITVKDIANKILRFDYGILDRRNIPSPILIKNKNLHQNASQMHCLMKHIPFILVHLLTLEDKIKKKRFTMPGKS